jgi:hypothetical protein
MKKIRIKSSWTTDEKITKRLLSQFKTSNKDVENLEFVDDGSEEVVVFFGYITEELKQGLEYYVFLQEPTWSGNHPKTFPSNDNLTIFGFDEKIYRHDAKLVENVSLNFYGGRGPESEGWDEWTYDNVKNNRPKSKIISSCVSSLGRDNNQIPEGCLYNKRVSIIERLINETDFIDIFSWESNGKNAKGWLNKKIDGVIDYKFSLCIENTHEKNYITEKFYDCILTDTIPIYYGCKNIKELCPENGYILIEDIDDIDSIVKLLKNIHENHQEIYNRLIPNCRKIKERYFNDYNPLKLINKLCE